MRIEMKRNLLRALVFAACLLLCAQMQPAFANMSDYQCTEFQSVFGAQCMPAVKTGDKCETGSTGVFLTSCPPMNNCCVPDGKISALNQKIAELDSEKAKGPANTGEGACTQEVKAECGNTGEGGPTDTNSYICRDTTESCTKEFGTPRTDNYSKVCDASFPVCCTMKRCAGASGGAGAADATGGATPAASAPAVNYTLTNPLGSTSISEIMGKVVTTFLGIVGALALLVFIYGGMAWMTARGDAGQVKTAQGALKNGLIGLAIIAFSYTITSSVLQLLLVDTAADVPPEARNASAEAPTESQQDQTNLAAQQKQAQEQQKAQEQAASSKPQCPTGYQCQSKSGMNQENWIYCRQTVSGNSVECGEGAWCCNFNQTL